MCFSKLLKHLWKFSFIFTTLFCGATTDQKFSFNDSNRKEVVCLTSLTEITLESSGTGPRVQACALSRKTCCLSSHSILTSSSLLGRQANPISIQPARGVTHCMIKLFSLLDQSRAYMNDTRARAFVQCRWPCEEFSVCFVRHNGIHIRSTTFPLLTVVCYKSGTLFCSIPFTVTNIWDNP